MSPEARRIWRSALALALVQAAVVLPQQVQPEERATAAEPVTLYPPATLDPTGAEGSIGSDIDLEEEAQARPSFDALTVSAAGLYDDLLGFGAQHVHGAPSLLGATLLIDRRPSEHAEFVLAYQPEAEVFFGQPDLNTFNHAAGAFARTQIGERSQLAVGGSYIGAGDPTRYLGSQLLVSPEGPYREGTAYAELAHTVRRTSMQLRVEGSYTTLDRLPDLGIDHLRETSADATATVAHTFDSRTGLSLSYSYLRPHLTGALSGDPSAHLLFDQPEQTAILGVSQPFGRLVVQLSGGALHQGRRYEPLIALDVQRGGRLNTLRFRYEHAPLSLGFLPTAAGNSNLHSLVPSALLPGRFVDTGAVELSAWLFHRVTWRQLAWVARTDRSAAGTLTSWGTTGRLTLPLTDRLGAFAEAETYAQGGFFGKRILLGVSCAVAGNHTPAANRFNDTLLAGVLPQRRGM